jgi:hypothetical protein
MPPVELFGCRRSSIFDYIELALLDQMHSIDANDQGASAAKVLESKRFLCQSLDAYRHHLSGSSAA